MSKRTARALAMAAAAAAVAVLAAGCGGGGSSTNASSGCFARTALAHPSWTNAQVSAACAGSSSQPNASLANAYLATGLTWVDYLQWNSTGSGSFTGDTLTGTAPDEQVSSNQTPMTVYVNGSEVTFDGLNPQNGTLADGALTLQVLAPDGTLTTVVFSPGTQAQFNSAVQALQGQAASDNSTELQQQASASSASASAAAEQQAQSDLTAVRGIGFASDLSKLAGDVSQENSALAAEQTAAAAGPNADGGDCYNLDSNVDYDAQENVQYDQQENVGYDMQQGLQPDITSARSAVSALQSDLSGLSSAGLPAPSGASAAINAAQGTISSAISTANGDISQANSDVNQAYAIANGIATGSCAGDGPGSPPSPIPGLS
jgi:hypothetical protein